MNIALIGYGKMGHMIESICKERGHNIVSIIDVDNQDDFESAAIASADVAIEFTSPTAAYGNYLRAWKAGVKVVSGSTGWMKDHGDDVRRACTEEGKTLFWASNFSIGVAIFSAVNRYLAKIMNQFSQYDVRMSETHHIHKLGEQHLADGTVEGTNDVAADQLAIESIRRDEVPGIHTICYDSDADSITITHDAHSRKGFALGAVLAAEYTKEHEGLLTTKDLFKF